MDFLRSVPGSVVAFLFFGGLSVSILASTSALMGRARGGPAPSSAAVACLVLGLVTNLSVMIAVETGYLAKPTDFELLLGALISIGASVLVMLLGSAFTRIAARA